MSTITAGATASIRFSTPLYREAPTHDADIVQRYIRWFGKTVDLHVADIKLGAVLYKPWRADPVWLSAIRDRIRLSIQPHDGGNSNNEGQWLRQDVADAAFDFFSATADILPGEPFIYSSRQGDLVAEIKGRNGPLTCIVSPTFVMLFAIAHGKPIEKKVLDLGHVRNAVKELLMLENE